MLSFFIHCLTDTTRSSRRTCCVITPPIADNHSGVGSLTSGWIPCCDEQQSGSVVVVGLNPHRQGCEPSVGAPAPAQQHWTLSSSREKHSSVKSLSGWLLWGDAARLDTRKENEILGRGINQTEESKHWNWSQSERLSHFLCTHTYCYWICDGLGFNIHRSWLYLLFHTFIILVVRHLTVVCVLGCVFVCVKKRYCVGLVEGKQIYIDGLALNINATYMIKLNIGWA